MSGKCSTKSKIDVVGAVVDVVVKLEKFRAADEL